MTQVLIQTCELNNNTNTELDNNTNTEQLYVEMLSCSLQAITKVHHYQNIGHSTHTDGEGALKNAIFLKV